MTDFEKILEQLSTPEIANLKHQDALSNAILQAKEKNIISWWWLSIPVYVITMFAMKTCFVPNTNISKGIQALKTEHFFLTIFLFVILPVLLIIFNVFVIRKIFLLCRDIKMVLNNRSIFFNIITIILSLIILFFYTF